MIGMWLWGRKLGWIVMFFVCMYKVVCVGFGGEDC